MVEKSKRPVLRPPEVEKKSTAPKTSLRPVLRPKKKPAQKNNPTRNQMEKFLMTTSANKGGLMKKKKLNKGGMIDYRKTGMFK